MDDERSFQYFRLLLALGALVSVVAGVGGLLSPSLLDSWLGLKGTPSTPGFTALGRLFGAASIALGLGYVLAAVDPSRQRSLLAVLFCVPLATSLALLVGTLGDDLSAVKGWLFAAFTLGYTLVYVRLYPRHRAPTAPAAQTD